MAYVSAEMKAARAPEIRKLLKQYGLKGTLSVKHNSTLRLTVSSGSIDFIGQANLSNQKVAKRRREKQHVIQGDLRVNTYYINDTFTGTAAEFLNRAVAALKGADYYDNSDIQTDYFDRSHYIDIYIGRWDKPYQLAA